MKFLFIIAHDAQFFPDATLFEDIANWIKCAESKGARCYGNPLRPASDAVTVRVRHGDTVQSPGPFSKSSEQMCAYEMVECATMEAALALAASHPMAAAATIEVRPVWEEIAV